MSREPQPTQPPPRPLSEKIAPGLPGWYIHTEKENTGHARMERRKAQRRRLAGGR